MTNRALACSLLISFGLACGQPSGTLGDQDGGPDAGDGDAGSRGSDAGADGGADSGPGLPDGGSMQPFTSRLVIQGDPAEGLGIFDPSAAWDPSAGGALAYSAVAPDQSHVHTRVATSADRGATWTFAAEPNQADAGTLSTSDNTVCNQSTCTGTIVHEVPSLIVDPGDTADRRYKLFTHSYFVDSAGRLHYQLGNLALQTAPAVAGPWTYAPLLGWNSSSAFSSQGAAQNISSDVSLGGVSHCLALTEPGAMVRTSGTGTIIDLAVGCVFFQNGAGVIEIDLLRSTDHAHSFSFISTLLSSADATALGSNNAQINAADLFQHGGETYLFASPSGPVTFPDSSTGEGYRGCLVLRFSNLDLGQLARDAGNHPLVAAAYTGGPTQFAGACTFRDDLSGLGLAGDVLAVGSNSPFGIFELH